MDEYIEGLSDTSSSNRTIVVDNEEIDDILKKYANSGSAPVASKSVIPNKTKNIYDLSDFSDDEFNYEPLETRIKRDSAKDEFKTPKVNIEGNRSWQEKFSTEDFCDDSNDFNVVLNRIRQLESEQFKGENRQEVSKEIQSLISGAIIENPKERDSEKQFKRFSEQPKSSFGWSAASDEDTNDVLYFDAIKNDFKFDAKSASSIDLESNSEDMLDHKNKRTRKKSSVDIETEKLEKEMAKAAKIKERELKKQEKENQKALKNALKVVGNCVKPDQCVQYVTVNIDENIANKDYGEVIQAGLKSGGYNYKVSKQLVPNIISFTRKVPTIDNLLLQNVFQQEKHYLLVMTTQEFFHHIVEKTLVGHIQSLLSMSDIHHLSLAILGLAKYYKYLKDEKNKDFRAAVVETDANKKNTPNYLEFKNMPRVYKNDVELALVELQIFCKNCYIRPVDKYEDLAVFVGECTKSVAQIPYKAAKADALEQENEFFVVNNRDCVRVDKDGNGLSRLWNQFLRMFPLASLETAEAVTSVYPSLNSLMEAYANCKNSEEAIKLLQDIPVRRAAGPLSGQRKIGPEFSKRVYKFFCSEENILL